MGFELDIGLSSLRGRRDVNEDFAVVRPPAPADHALGWIAAIADGVSAGGGGRLAAQTTVLSVTGDYFGVPPTWDTTVALDRLIGAQNTWLAGQNRNGRRSALTTLTVLVLRGHAYTLAHVGDSRAWLLRDGICLQLTNDHALDHPDLASRLTRAVGLDDALRIDHLQGELHAGDTFALTTDGVHGPLPRRRLVALMAAGDAQSASAALAEAALAAGGSDNATALVIRVRGLEPGRYEDLRPASRLLPVPGRLRPGDGLDGCTITAAVADTGVHRLYQARIAATQELVAIKTLHESRANDPQEREMLAHEAWLGLQLAERMGAPEARGAAGFVRVRELPSPSAFYVVYDWHAGQTLAQRLQSGTPRAPVGEVVAAAIAIGKALARMHRAGVVHRDIKPENLHLGDDGRWRILDLGAAVSGREPKVLRLLRAGTPSYMNPEQWADEPAPPDAGSDLFAFGVTLYRWLAGRLPYGELEPFQKPRFRRDPVAPSRLAPDVPIWLDHLVLKAVAIDPRERFETAEEMVLALERGAARPLDAQRPTPLAVRDPAALWAVGFWVSMLFNLLLVYWLLFLPR